ncbi:hypothetical protein EPO05_07320 [Patescibacteria group bacterium]|nr:MAG: hypothetical protein EPO05_07320 [Patescibacteria group bacterium]
MTHDGAQWVLTGPEVLFTGFVSREGAVGFMVFQSATLLFWAPFADGQPRTLIDEADRLFVTPQLLFREGG